MRGLTREEQERVAFLSCGSQLRVIFRRALPAYVNLATHRALFGFLGGAWINLYRRTDVLAGPVLSWTHTEDGSRHFPRRPASRAPTSSASATTAAGAAATPGG